MIKCSCGNAGCTTVLYLDQATGSVDLRIEWKDNGATDQHSIALSPNEIVLLIKQLKSSLNDLANQ
jgi:hypothetical protein